VTSSHGGRRWLALAGAVSSYTWDLFADISQRFGITVDTFHRPPPPSRIRSSFAHESFRSESTRPGYDWSRLGRHELVQKMDVPSADAVLVLGTLPKVAIVEALRRKSRDCPVVFMADTNIADIFPREFRSWARMLAYRSFAGFVTEAWTLGLSNEHAFRLLGFRRFRALPFYSVTFRELGAPRVQPASISPGPFKLLTIARLAPEKNLQALVRAVSGPDLPGQVELTLVGEGAARSNIEALIRTLPQGAVRLTGAVPHHDLGPYLQSAHALVIPSLVEPWGNVVTEALGMGIPVLATPAVGAATSLAGLYGGIRISESVDERGIHLGLRSLMTEYSSLASAAVGGAARIRAAFDVQSVAQQAVDAIGHLRSGQS